MSYMALARKYRPQSFADVAGQGVVARTLTNAIRKDRVHHAYLFTGPRGVGKTSTARILAKGLCCDRGPTPEPCGACDHCRMIADSTHPDVAEIDAATHNGVDHIRELNDSATFAPTLARAKIFILDEVHMLSASAWNALLKLLEEPPPHVRFIFATTEVEKVIPTVLSRCQRFDFRMIDLDDIVARLREVCAGEGMELDDAILYRIARAAGGGMRDAQTLLDQLIAISDEGVAEDDVNLLLAAARGEDMLHVVRLLADGDSATAIGKLDQLVASGVSADSLLQQLLDHYRQLMLIKTCGADAKAVQRLGTVSQEVVDQAGQLPLEQILRI
ncbi:MAG: DNA polymerase III subunit gamma/tau [Planctomycetota bacterium]